MSAAALPPTPAPASPAEAKARAFLALETVGARGNLSLAARLSRAVGAHVDDRFQSANEARRLPDATVMARIAHERETYNKSSSPAFVRAVFAQVEDVKTRAFANLRRLLDEKVVPADMVGDFERVRREAIKIPLEERGFAQGEFVKKELVAFLQWFERKYVDVVNGVRSARYSESKAFVNSMPVAPTGIPGFEKNAAARLKALGIGGRRKTRKQKRAHRKTRRSQRR